MDSLPEHRPEGQVDPRGFDFLGFWDAVEPVALGAALHDEQAAALQQNGNLVLPALVLEAEFPFRAKTDGSDGAVLAERFLVVAVPGHAFIAVVIEIEQAGVEGAAGEFLDERFEGGEFRSPGESAFGGAGVAVGEIRIAIPSDFAGGDDVLAENDGLVVFPRADSSG